jgi:RES domain-containing protein
MLTFRIGHKNYAASLTASGVAGRWASAGKKVIYAAESIALALLENMVRRQGVGFNDDFKIVVIEIPDDIAIHIIKPGELKAGWRNFREYTICQVIGNKWFDAQDTCILKVPSAVIPESSNYVINTLHPDFKRIKIVQISPLVPDERIEQLLKTYHK